MTRHSIKQPITFIVFSLCCLAAINLLAQSSRVVEEIEIRETKAVPMDYVKQQIKTKIGSTHNPQQVQRDFEAVLKIGCFDALRCSVTERTAPKGGMLVIFALKETGELCPATKKN